MIALNQLLPSSAGHIPLSIISYQDPIFDQHSFGINSKMPKLRTPTCYQLDITLASSVYVFFLATASATMKLAKEKVSVTPKPTYDSAYAVGLPRDGMAEIRRSL